MTDEQCRKLKTAILSGGPRRFKEFAGFTPDTFDKDELMTALDNIIAQMPEEELRTYYDEYCKDATEQKGN